MADMNYGIRYPSIKVRLTGRDGNAFAIMGRVTKAMRDHHVPATDIRAFMEECTKGDYHDLLVAA
jgi:hypothetical protein